jgi:predicted nucleic acid-binding protein
MSGNPKKPLLCWDSCVFLAWFQKEQDKPLAAIEEMLREISKDKVSLLVSAISFAEVLDRAGGSDAGTQFRQFVKRENIVVADADTRVASLAAQIRIAGLEALAQGKISQGVKIPDALIAATAVIYHADRLYTFDPVLLEISGWPVVRGLAILPPSAEPSPLGF